MATPARNDLVQWNTQMDQLAKKWSTGEKVGVIVAAAFLALGIYGVTYCCAHGVSDMGGVFVLLGSMYAMGGALLAPILLYNGRQFHQKRVEGLRQLPLLEHPTQLQKIYSPEWLKEGWISAAHDEQIQSCLKHYDKLMAEKKWLDNPPQKDLAYITRLAHYQVDAPVFTSNWVRMCNTFQTEEQARQTLQLLPAIRESKDLMACYSPRWKELGLISEELDQRICRHLDDSTRLRGLADKLDKLNAAEQSLREYFDIPSLTTQLERDSTQAQQDFQQLQNDIANIITSIPAHNDLVQWNKGIDPLAKKSSAVVRIWIIVAAAFVALGIYGITYCCAHGASDGKGVLVLLGSMYAIAVAILPSIPLYASEKFRQKCVEDLRQLHTLPVDEQPKKLKEIYSPQWLREGWISAELDQNIKSCINQYDQLKAEKEYLDAAPVQDEAYSTRLGKYHKTHASFASDWSRLLNAWGSENEAREQLNLPASFDTSHMHDEFPKT